MLSYLNVECFQKKWDRVDILIDETRRMGILISAKNLNVCKLKFSMSEDRVGSRTKYTITPSLLCKGLKMSAAEEISLKQPFKSYEDFVQKIDTTVVDTEAITALQDAGFFPKTKDAVDKFVKLRDHIRATRKKGMSGVDIFQ